jgi:hypothetical protein
MDDIMQSALKDILEISMTIIVTVVVPYLVVIARSYFKAKIDKIQDQQSREKLTWAYERLEATATTVVREIDQLVKQRIDGKVAEHKKLQALAMEHVIKRLPASAVRTFEAEYGLDRLSAIVRGKIESKVKVKP